MCYCVIYDAAPLSDFKNSKVLHISPRYIFNHFLHRKSALESNTHGLNFVMSVTVAVQCDRNVKVEKQFFVLGADT